MHEDAQLATAAVPRPPPPPKPWAAVRMAGLPRLPDHCPAVGKVPLWAFKASKAPRQTQPVTKAAARTASQVSRQGSNPG